MKIMETSIGEFVQKLAGASATPGGGSVAALAGALGAALCAMVGRLTAGRPKFRDVTPEMNRMLETADRLSLKLLELADKDIDAYNRVMTAFKMPKESDKQSTLRREAIQNAFKQASRVPMQTLQTLEELVGLVEKSLFAGNPNCFTDAAVAAELVRAAARSAAYNVRINLPEIDDKEFVQQIQAELAQRLPRIFSVFQNLEKTIDGRLG
ncbi:MAG: methenyltetrahydrofolate cyclohydrolase [Desulfobacterales bacterium CG07_land_8_20_14_0_80_52_14]|nr:MAG: methenyltetrahydrofolate cyclohydrolase [Desulfobacterales bacterium CG23_combo_of_CG06-09_8_20_14_all_52_9]PIU50425.1 MAG: methenyltetrahydrofolate cyclohydrolase [Desulfobacterales bacterium CG07_land_8_20_14_0_80_52_14]